MQGKRKTEAMSDNMLGQILQKRGKLGQKLRNLCLIGENGANL